MRTKCLLLEKAIFLEKEFILKKESGSKVQLEEIQEPQNPIEDEWRLIAIHKELWNSNQLHENLEDLVRFVTSSRDMDFS